MLGRLLGGWRLQCRWLLEGLQCRWLLGVSQLASGRAVAARLYLGPHRRQQQAAQQPQHRQPGAAEDRGRRGGHLRAAPHARGRDPREIRAGRTGGGWGGGRAATTASGNTREPESRGCGRTGCGCFRKVRVVHAAEYQCERVSGHVSSLVATLCGLDSSAVWHRSTLLFGVTVSRPQTFAFEGLAAWARAHTTHNTHAYSTPTPYRDAPDPPTRWSLSRPLLPRPQPP